MNYKRITFIAVILVLCVALSACALINDSDKKTLTTPSVSIDNEGLVSWEKVENASGYAYIIDDGETVETTNTSVKLEDGQSIKVKAVGDKKYGDSGFSATISYVAKDKLSTPFVVVDAKGTASWEKVENASSYVYVIDDGENVGTTNTSVTLQNGQSIKVKAVGGNDFRDSDFSASVTYTVSSEILLDAPVIEIDTSGNATWNSVPNASGYTYVIGDEYTFVVEPIKVKLEHGQSIKVRAVGEGIYVTSDFSAIVRYFDEAQIIQLATPVVSIDEDGLATWEAIENASGYAYTVDGGAIVVTSERQVQLENGQSVKVKAVGKDEYSDSEFSEIQYYTVKVKVKLQTPTVTVNEDGYATWSVVENASGYEYKIDDGKVLRATEDKVKLEYNQQIKVRAVGNTEYENSDFSDAVYYIKDTPCASHTDEDNDGICDICFEDVVIELSFLAINDLHGKFIDTENQPGVDELTTYLKKLYQDTEREEILLSSGDMWQGTVESSTNKGALMTEWMNEVGFVSMTLGNHEFDWGTSYITKNSTNADFPYLAINARYNGKPIAGVQSSVVVEKRGVKIGIIGAIGDCVSSISGEFNKGLNFISGEELTKLVKDEATRLREQESCMFIVYSIHAGASGLTGDNVNQSVFDSNGGYYDESLSNGYVNLVFESHTHQNYVVKDSYGVYHIQGGSENKYLSVSNVSLNSANGYSTVTAHNLSSNVYGNSSSYESDPIVDEIFEKYFPDDNPYTTVLGKTYSTVYSDAICDKVAELYYNAGVKKWGADYNIVLGGGFLSCRNPYRLYSGNITYADLFAVMPFDNTIVLGSITGYNLKSKFINSSNSRYHVYYTVDVASISDTKRYYIITDTYSSTYSYNGITEIARYDSGIYARDLLAEFLKKDKVWN